jgi:hypothetical protein
MLNVKFKVYVFDVLTTVLRQIQVFWDVTLFSKRRESLTPGQQRHIANLNMF